MYLFGGYCFTFQQAILTERMGFKVLLADSPPHFAAIYLFGFVIPAVTVVVPVFFSFMYSTVLAAVHGKIRTAGVSARSARFSRHRFHLAFRVKGKTHTDVVVRMSLLCIFNLP